MFHIISFFLGIMFIESICVKDGKAPLLDLHQNRMDRTYAFHYKVENPFSLATFVEEVPPTATFKLRIVYDHSIQQINHSLYIKRDVKTLQVVSADDINYDFKYADRDELNSLHERRNKKDDIIIVKNDLVTDSFYSNLIFWDGDKWMTPINNLLQGVRRQYLINTKQIHPAKINVKDIFFYDKVGLINAMLDIDDINVSVENVFM
ncbi:MAG: aminotransferase class IV [Bacteroidota bacterium]